MHGNENQMVDTYLQWVGDVRGRQPLTVDSYRSTLRCWQRYLCDEAHITVSHGTLEDLEGFMVRPRQKRGRGTNGAVATQRREVACIRGFYKWAASRGYVDVDPMVEAQAPTVKARQPRPITDKVWLQAWAQPMSDPLRSALGLGFFCGLRRAEITTLTTVQLTDRRIVGFVRKGGGEDTLPWATLVEVYVKHLPHLGAEQFLRSLSAVRHRGVYVTPYRDPDWLNRAMHAAGFPFTPHQLRHSCATNLIRAGVPLPVVSRMMNHSSITTTMLYVKAGGDELSDWLRASGG